MDDIDPPTVFKSGNKTTYCCIAFNPDRTHDGKQKASQLHDIAVTGFTRRDRNRFDGRFELFALRETE